MVGNRDIFDHFPIWLLCLKKNWGPKPFQFLKVLWWLNGGSFRSLVARLLLLRKNLRC